MNFTSESKTKESKNPNDIPNDRIQPTAMKRLQNYASNSGWADIWFNMKWVKNRKYLTTKKITTRIFFFKSREYVLRTLLQGLSHPKNVSLIFERFLDNSVRHGHENQVIPTRKWVDGHVHRSLLCKHALTRSGLTWFVLFAVGPFTGSSKQESTTARSEDRPVRIGPRF